MQLRMSGRESPATRCDRDALRPHESQRPALPGGGRPWPRRRAGARRAHLRALLHAAGRGTGLGLFLARELAQTNGATLLYEPRAGGGSVFRLVFADPRRWEVEMNAGCDEQPPRAGQAGRADRGRRAGPARARQPDPEPHEPADPHRGRRRARARKLLKSERVRPLPHRHAPAGRRRPGPRRLDPGEPRRRCRWR